MGTFDKIRSKIKALECGFLHGQTPLSYLELGLLYQIVKEYDKAEETFKKAIITLPDNVYPRFLLLRLYETQGERAKGALLAQELMQAENPKISIALRMELQKMNCWKSSTTDKMIKTNAHAEKVKIGQKEELASAI